jgi:hypothetical protein
VSRVPPISRDEDDDSDVEEHKIDHKHVYAPVLATRSLPEAGGLQMAPNPLYHRERTATGQISPATRSSSLREGDSPVPTVASSMAPGRAAQAARQVSVVDTTSQKLRSGRGASGGIPVATAAMPVVASTASPALTSGPRVRATPGALASAKAAARRRDAKSQDTK